MTHMKTLLMAFVASFGLLLCGCATNQQSPIVPALAGKPVVPINKSMAQAE